jgi:hypothetical protein
MISPNRPALLLDKSAVPAITVMPQVNGFVELSVHLRNYNTNENYSYSYHSTSIPTNELIFFFYDYAIQPEETLLKYFSWKAQSTSSKRLLSVPTTKPNPEDISMMELL